MTLNRYNELDYAEKLLEHGFITKYVKYELKIVAKYYKYNNIPYNEIESKIYEFCKKYFDDFCEVKHFKLINSVINYVKKKNNVLIIIDEISITKCEADYIDKLDISDDYKKFVFCLLARYKLDKGLYEYSNDKEYTSQCFSYKIDRQKEVFKMSMLSRYKYKFDDILHDLYKKQIIDILDNGRLKLNFLEDMNSDGPSIICVDTISIDKAGYFWDLYNGSKKIKKCSECGIVISVNRKSHRYCKDCSKKIDIRKSVERKRKERKV